jgi:hypothetical protein
VVEPVPRQLFVKLRVSRVWVKMCDVKPAKKKTGKQSACQMPVGNQTVFAENVQRITRQYLSVLIQAQPRMPVAK